MGQGTHGDGRYGQYGQFGDDPTAPVPQDPQHRQYGQFGDDPTAPVPQTDGTDRYGAYGATMPDASGAGGRTPSTPPPTGWGTAASPGGWGAPAPGSGWGALAPGTGWGAPAPAAGSPGGYGQFGMADAPGTGSWAADSMAGGRPGIIPLRPLRLGDILEGAFAAVRHNPAVMFFYAGVVGVVGAILAVVPNWAASNATTSLTIEEASGVQALGSLVLAAVIGLTSLAATGALVISVSRSAIGQRVSIGQVWSAVKGRILALLGLSLLIMLIVWGLALLTGIILGIGMVAVVAGLIAAAPESAGGVVAVIALIVVAVLASAIPMFIVLARLSLAYPAVVLEKAGPGTALSRSWSLTKGSTWRVVGIYVLAFLIAGVIVAVVGVPVALVGQLLGLSPALMVIAVTLLDVLVSLVTTPFTAGVISLVYIDQRMRREGLDVQLARAAANRG